MAKFKCYHQPLKRLAFIKEVDSREEAITFLKVEYPNFGIVKYDGVSLTLEELENATSLRPEPRTEFADELSDGVEVSEDTDSELFDAPWSRTE